MVNDMNHNAIFISNYGAGKASVVKLDEQAYNQFTSSQDAEFAKFKKAYADGKLGVIPTPGYSEGDGVRISPSEYPGSGDEVPYPMGASANSVNTKRGDNPDLDPLKLYDHADRRAVGVDKELRWLSEGRVFLESLLRNAEPTEGKLPVSFRSGGAVISTALVHDSQGNDYVLMYNPESNSARISPFRVFYGACSCDFRLEVEEFNSIVKNYGGFVDKQDKLILSISAGGEGGDVGDGSDVFNVSISKDPVIKGTERAIALTRRVEYEGDYLYVGTFHGWFNINRATFESYGQYERNNRTPVIFFPGVDNMVFVDAVYKRVIKNGYCFDRGTLVDVLEKLPEGVRLVVPVLPDAEGELKMATATLYNGELVQVW